MNRLKYFSFLAIISLILFGTESIAQATKPLPGFKQDTWTQAQLMQPAILASLLNNPKASKPILFNIGVMDDIRGARNIGAASEKLSLNKFQKVLNTLPKNSLIVVYCGCCPFEKCPNIRPAFNLAMNMGFKNAMLLNLPKNIKTDWKDKGYPMAKK